VATPWFSVPSVFQLEFPDGEHQRNNRRFSGLPVMDLSTVDASC